jgi:hypothetical protein
MHPHARTCTRSSVYMQEKLANELFAKAAKYCAAGNEVSKMFDPSGTKSPVGQMYITGPNFKSNKGATRGNTKDRRSSLICVSTPRSGVMNGEIETIHNSLSGDEPANHKTISLTTACQVDRSYLTTQLEAAKSILVGAGNSIAEVVALFAPPVASALQHPNQALRAGPTNLGFDYAHT